MLLSEHFSYEELTTSDTAARFGIDNTPNDFALKNLRRLARFLEGVRAILGDKPIHINSGFRTLMLNRKVGSKDTSAHVMGLAADIICPAFGPAREICVAIRDSDIQFDQVLREFDETGSGWCHFAIVSEGLVGRRQCLTIDARGTREGIE